MDRKFYIGLLVIAFGTSIGSIVLVLSMRKKIADYNRKKEDSETAANKEFLANVHAMKNILRKTRDGDYEVVPDKNEAIRNDFEFYRITYLNKE